MNTLIITRQWQCSDPRVTDVVNNLVHQVALRNTNVIILGVYHVIPQYSALEVFVRSIASLPLSLLNGVLSLNVNDSCANNDKYKMILYPYRRRNDYFNSLNFMEYFDPTEVLPDRAIIHWLDPGLIIAKKLHSNIKVTLVIHELNIKKILSRLNLGFEDFEVVDKILVRNKSVQVELLKAGYNSKILRSGI